MVQAVFHQLFQLCQELICLDTYCLLQSLIIHQHPELVLSYLFGLERLNKVEIFKNIRIGLSSYSKVIFKFNLKVFDEEIHGLGL